MSPRWNSDFRIKFWKVGTKTHFTALINLTKILIKKRIKKFIQIGSSAEYGDIEAPQTEELYGISNSTYALAKLQSTKFLVSLYITKKFPSIILRFFQVYGPNQDENRILPQVIKGCLNDNNFLTSSGKQIRDFCYIDDVVRANILAATSDNVRGAEIINIGSGENHSVLDIVKIFQAKKIYVSNRKGEADETLADINKAKELLHWRPNIFVNNWIKEKILK